MKNVKFIRIPYAFLLAHKERISVIIHVLTIQIKHINNSEIFKVCGM